MNSVLVDHELFMNNMFKFNPELFSNFSNNEDLFQNHDFFTNNNNEVYNNSPEIPDFVENNQFHPDESNNISPEIPDFPDDCLKFITDILLEEGFDKNPASAQECKALQDTEKSLYDALGAQYPYPNPNPNPNPSPESLTLDLEVEGPDGSSTSSEGSLESNLSRLRLKLDSVGSDDFGQLDGQNHSPSVDKPELIPKNKLRKQVKSTRRKKGRRNDESDEKEGRVHKIQATNNEDYVEMEQYDDVLLCSEYEQQKFTEFSPLGSSKSSRNKKQISKHDEVDLRVLLTQCAQAVSTFDLKTANELLRKIRQHASPYGDAVQRLAHHVANGLEARIAGTGSTISADIVDVKISTADFLKAYKMYVSAIPFKRMSYFVANTTILKLAEKAKKIHIIDFGIFLGLQWPCLIKRLSKFPGGPPSLRITGVDFPQQGFRPAARIDATGRRLSGYSERFGVPFQYTGIADKWENLKPSDFKIENDELVIVNCMYRSGTLHDETVDTNSPRDKFLKLVQNLNPDLFVHGVINGTFNAPFFITRFKEAIYHYSSVFEVFEATMARESHERLLIESEVYGKEVYNLVACEGVERVQRPESYKQWQVRQARAGLQKTTLDRELVSRAKAMVKGNYHGDFLVDEDKNWMLQGWKGRIFCALSFWRPSLM